MAKKETTALQDLISWLWEEDNIPDGHAVIKKATELLEKEKTQIINAANYGYVKKEDLQGGANYFNNKFSSNE